MSQQEGKDLISCVVFMKLTVFKNTESSHFVLSSLTTLPIVSALSNFHPIVQVCTRFTYFRFLFQISLVAAALIYSFAHNNYSEKVRTPTFLILLFLD